MKQLNELLKEFVEKSNYTVYSLSFISKVNRTTLQRAINGERSISKENLDKIVPYLNLTLNEKADLEAAFTVSQIGEYTFRKHLYIKDLLENIDFVTSNAAEEEEIPIVSLSSPVNESRLVKGIFNIIKLICQIVAYNMENSEAPFLYALSPFHNRFFRDLYDQLQLSFFDNLEILHIVPFFRAPREDSGSSLFNLEMLSTLLPFALSDRQHCSFSYYYESADFSSLSGVPMPYYVLLNHNVVLIAQDYQSAFILPDAFLHPYRKHFEKILHSSLPLLDTLDTPTLLSVFSDTTINTGYSYAIEAQPCLTYHADASMIARAINKKIPRQEQQVLSQKLLAQCENLRSLKKAVSVFSKRGYDDFVKNGIIYQVPGALMRPLNAKERITILERLIASNKEGNREYLLIKSSVFRPRIEFFSYDTASIMFYIMSGENEFRTCILKEPNLIESFNDFVMHLNVHGYTYSAEETADIFQSSITKLRTASDDAV